MQCGGVFILLGIATNHINSRLHSTRIVQYVTGWVSTLYVRLGIKNPYKKKFHPISVLAHRAFLNIG
jgi:hypothetical protein